MKRKYIKADEIKTAFHFLNNYGFVLKREENLNYGAYVEFIGNGIKIYLGAEYKDYVFDFLIYKGENLDYSDALYGTEIKSFCDLAKAYDLAYNCDILQPNHKGYEEALHNNAILLKKYGERILKGDEWF